MSEALVRREADGAVCTLCLNRPEKRNALNVALLRALWDGLQWANGNARVVILRGEGPSFCAGLDLDEAAQPATTEDSSELIAAVYRALAEGPFVSIAAVQGAAVAGGAGLMTACDLVVAAEDARIGYPETRRGLVAALAGVFLRRQVPDRAARELLLTGVMIGAARAREIGLVNRIVPGAELHAAARALAAEVLGGAPGAVAISKRWLNELWPQALGASLDDALEVHQHQRESSEMIEGVAAFRDKRPPVWGPKP
ncbi:MAG TPA: enoyl-CoA hydratase/isomerase family protein [Opitutaceae bacterium]|nr:enoyl-CoA hydratase/isomerase family protein [Opitutaceae bacterium]